MENVTGHDQCGVCGKDIGFSDDTIGMDTCEVCIDCARKAIKFVNRMRNLCSCGRYMDEHDLRDYKCDFETHQEYIQRTSLGA